MSDDLKRRVAEALERFHYVEQSSPAFKQGRIVRYIPEQWQRGEIASAIAAALRACYDAAETYIPDLNRDDAHKAHREAFLAALEGTDD